MRDRLRRAYRAICIEADTTNADFRLWVDGPEEFLREQGLPKDKWGAVCDTVRSRWLGEKNSEFTEPEARCRTYSPCGFGNLRLLGLPFVSGSLRGNLICHDVQAIAITRLRVEGAFASDLVTFSGLYESTDDQRAVLNEYFEELSWADLQSLPEHRWLRSLANPWIPTDSVQTGLFWVTERQAQKAEERAVQLLSRPLVRYHSAATSFELPWVCRGQLLDLLMHVRAIRGVPQGR